MSRDVQNLNCKLLHHFWVIAKTGGVAKAGEELHVSSQSISGQMRVLEAAFGGDLASTAQAQRHFAAQRLHLQPLR